ncbi:hypothetical protein Taro_035943 [Colocasia esculenta]|uniref:Uncharacterized protein n=1 Tax=Colocasia esculenta TaxID=4460 RepID=A0A843WK66_COLES|nr:hypothetical protein [Colocasia esculenta]
MSQCVPSWDLDDGPSHRLQSHHPSSAITRSPMADYEVAELTWENGQLSMHGHRGGAARAGKLAAKDPSASVPSWEKPGHASGTLEAVVDQATRAVVPSGPAAAQVPNSASGLLVPCLGGKSPYHTLRAPAAAAMDALVPCSNLRPQHGGDDPQPCRLVPDAAAGVADGGVGGTCVASCSGRKRTRVGVGDGNCSVTGSAASMGLTFDTCDINGAGEDTGFTSASPIDGSPETENTSCGRPLALTEDHDSVCHSRRTQRDGCYEEDKKIKGDVGRSSVSTKRSRAAAVHNQSERVSRHTTCSCLL